MIYEPVFVQQGQSLTSSAKASGMYVRRTVCFCLFVSHLQPIGLNVLGYQSHLLQRCYPACGGEGSSHFSSILPYEFSSRCKFSALPRRQLMVEFCLLTFSCFPLRKKKQKNSRLRSSQSGRLPLLHSGDKCVRSRNGVCSYLRLKG